MAEEKQHKPTAKRLRDARRDGKTAKSPLLTQAIQIIAVLAFLGWSLPQTWVNNQMLLEYLWTRGLTKPQESFEVAGAILAKLTLSFAAIVLFVTLVVEAAQVGVCFEPRILSLKLSLLSPANGLQRIFTGLKRLPLSLLKVGLLIGVLLYCVSLLIEELPAALLVSGSDGLFAIGEVLSVALRLSGAALMICGAADCFWKRKQFFKQLSMSHEELKRECKDDEGDPLVKAVRRAEHENLLKQDMIRRVRKAKVIVVERV